MNTLTITAHGTPAPQGSKKAVVIRGKARIVEDNKRTKPWRKTVTDAATYAANLHDWDTHAGPVTVAITFYMPRTPSHYGTGRNAGTLKAKAPTWHSVKPDVDKLSRAVLDSLTDAGVITDDSRVVSLNAVKRYANHSTGARITITPLDPSPAVPARPATGEDHHTPGDHH